MGKGLNMNQELATTGKFIEIFDGPKNQQSLKQYFDKDDTGQKLFTQVVIRAVQQDPDLLNADRNSLFLACQTAAQDGLLPDKKDGALVIYNTKVNNAWKKLVQWQPMIGGLRKKLAGHGFSIRAEIVYENDDFSYEMGDEPKIIHRPKVFGDRGAIVGAYAIATDEHGKMYRDTMDVLELEKVRATSKNPNGGAWGNWLTEMYRKTIAKRLFKQLPLISTELTELLDRDNEQFEPMGKPAGPSSVAQEVQQAARSAPIEGEVLPPKVTKKKVTKKKVVTKKPEPEVVVESIPDMGPNPPIDPEEEPDPIGF
jgi:phage RecT family recombinase